MITALSMPSNAARLWAYGGFEIRRVLRNRRFVFLSIGFPFLFYMLETGVLRGGSGPDGRLVFDGLPWATYFMVSMATYGALATTLSWSRIVATERTNGWTRQLRAMPLGSRDYLTTKLLVSFVTTLPVLVLVFGAGALVNHVALPATTWLALTVILALGSIPFTALGLLIGYLFDSDSVQGGSLVVNFGLAILGGLWFPAATFPDVLMDVARITPTYHFANLGWQVLARRAPDPVDVAVLAIYTLVFGVLVAWRYQADEQRAHA